MFLGDLVLAVLRGYPLATWATPFVYMGFVVQVIVGAHFRARRGGALISAFVGACAFFLISNFGVWISGLYAPTGSGIAACYIAAVPFFGPTLAGDLVWTVLLSAAYRPLAAWLEVRRPAWVPVRTIRISAV